MVVLAAPIFSQDSENDLDYIFKTTKHGRRKFAVYKILAVLTISTVILLYTRLYIRLCFWNRV